MVQSQDACLLKTNDCEKYQKPHLTEHPPYALLSSQGFHKALILGVFYVLLLFDGHLNEGWS